MTSGTGAADLLERHARLLFDLDAAGRIVAVNEPEPDPPPALWLARGAGGVRLLARADAPTDLVDRAADMVELLPPWDGTPLTPGWIDRLARATGLAVEGGPAFTFPSPPAAAAASAVEEPVVVDRSTAPLLEAHYPFTRRYLEVRSPVVGVVRDGAIVAVCMSCRTRPDAGEVGLHTQEAWRGRGFGRALVARWRAGMDTAGREPFYSTTWSNAASLAVARSLGLEPFAEELTLA